MSRAREKADLGNNASGLETLTVSDITDLTATASELNKLDGLTATTDELNLVDGSVSGPLSHRNLIINGDFRINQKSATSRTQTSSAYNYDRWYWDGTYLYQGVEDVNVRNGTFTLSWTDSGSDISAHYVVSTDTTASNGPDSGLTYTSVSNSGQIIVNEATEYSKHLWIRFGGTVANLSKVQLEEGSVATPFEHRSYADELQRCLRYYEFICGGIGLAHTNSTTSADYCHSYSVHKRTSATAYLKGTVYINDGNAQVPIQSISNQYHSFTTGILLSMSTNTVNNNEPVLVYSTSSSAGFEFDAEL